MSDQRTSEALPFGHSLPGRLAAQAHNNPEGVALREKNKGIWKETTWAGYLEAVRAVAAKLTDLGLGAGDRASILSDNRTEWVFADLGIQAIGALSVGIYQTNPPEDVAYVLQDSGSALLFVEDQEQADKAIAIREDTPLLKHIVVFDPRGLRHETDPRLMSWADFIEDGRRLASQAQTSKKFDDTLLALSPDAGAMVVYTSGTTGPPKGAVLCHRNVVGPGRDAAEHLGVGPGDSLLSYLPLCHVAEKIFTLYVPLAVGAVVHFGESIATVQTDLKEVSPTVFLGVPRIWEKMGATVQLKMKDADRLKAWVYKVAMDWGRQAAEARFKGEMSTLLRLRFALADLLLFRPLQEHLGLRRCRLPISGAAPISPELLLFFHSMGVEVLEGYGQTECAGVSHCNRPGRGILGSVGEPLPGVEQRIAEDGEILVRGDGVFTGYLNRPDATATTIDSEGWLHSGDLGAIDEGGYLRITGRKKEIIITAGGKNLSPEKIENALKLSPFIKEAVAIGDARKFISALIQVEFDTTADWATRARIPFTDFGDLVGREPIRALIAEAVEAANEHLAQVEKVKAFRLFPKELHQDDGELTPTQKVRRGFIQESYQGLIDDIYGGGRH